MHPIIKNVDSFLNNSLLYITAPRECIDVVKKLASASRVRELQMHVLSLVVLDICDATPRIGTEVGKTDFSLNAK